VTVPPTFKNVLPDRRAAPEREQPHLQPVQLDLASRRPVSAGPEAIEAVGRDEGVCDQPDENRVMTAERQARIHEAKAEATAVEGHGP
jgi:hypothetical protein